MSEALNDLLHQWIPYRLVYDEEEILCRWLYVNGQPFTDPFFDETILKCLRFQPNSQRHKSLSDISMLAEWAPKLESLEPSAIIFHVSRCGSTLVSQSLALNPQNISLSEVPLFDEILRMPFKNAKTGETEAGKFLKAAIQFYAVKRSRTEKDLFIKTDSWHLLFYRQLRALFPATPFIILYRHPSEVLASHQRQKGIQAVPGLIEPALLGINHSVIKNVHPGNYMAIVLEKYFEKIIEISRQDNNTLVVNYTEGLAGIMKKIATFTGMKITPADVKVQEERSRFHAKYPAMVFDEKPRVSSAIDPAMERLMKLYTQIENLRQEVTTLQL